MNKSSGVPISFSRQMARLRGEEKEYLLKRSRVYHKDSESKNPERHALVMKNSRYKNRYGITNVEVEAMLVKQNYRCAICERDIHIGHYVDHNHSTGQVRAMLCNDCNSMIGYAHENEGVLHTAIDYLNNDW